MGSGRRVRGFMQRDHGSSRRPPGRGIKGDSHLFSLINPSTRSPRLADNGLIEPPIPDISAPAFPAFHRKSGQSSYETEE